MKRWLLTGLKFALSGFLIAYLFNRIGIESAVERLTSSEPGLFVGAVAIMVLQFGLAVLRWNAVLAALGAPLPFVSALRLIFIGGFFSQTLPSSVGGDAVRMYGSYKAGMPLAAAVNSVLLERGATVLSLLLMVAVLQPFAGARLSAAAPAWVFPLLCVIAIGGVIVLMFLDRLPASLSSWKLVRGLAYLATHTRRLFLAPRHWSKTLFWCLIGHINLSLCAHVLALSLGLGGAIRLTDSLVLIPLVILITTLPISIAGWGVRELAMVQAMGLIGIPAESALALSVLLGLTSVLVSLPGGVVWLLSSDRQAMISDESEKLAETPPA